MKGCMPLIGLDGCHTKGHHPGQLLTVIGIYANNGIFLIAYAMVERESEETWTWFLEYLQQDVKIERDNSYMFMTEKQNGLDNALKARSTTIPWFNKHMDEMKMIKDKIVNWFDDKNPSHWSRAFFKEETKCDILFNNLCESFNSSILSVRDKPILAMLERIMMDMMVRNANRMVACEKWKDVVGPRIKKMLDKVRQRATQYRAHKGGEFVFQVTGFGENGSQNAVNLDLHTCTCKRWQLSGIPCVHIICCIRFKKQDVALYCHDYLMCTTYMQAYTPVINLIVGEDDWEPVDYSIASSLFNKLPGKPKKKRISSQGENGNPAPPTPIEGKLLKTGVTMTCKLCGQ
ncbi:hypothetical protein ACLB2K_049648 [Fragaria x ananassa]